MSQTPPSLAPLSSLDDLLRLVGRCAELRRDAAGAVLAGRPVTPRLPASLAQIVAELRRAAGRDHVVRLTHSDDTSLDLDLTAEIQPLEDDLAYLEDGREALQKRLGKRRPGLRDAIRRGLKALAGESFNTLLCDADALFRQPGQRLATTVQPAWNAVAACRFALARSRNPILWSEAPLPDLLARATLPPATFAYAASLGRQWHSANGLEGHAPLSQEKQDLLDAINARLANLMDQPDWLPFTVVGSGLQFRRGETSIARQDSAASIDEDTSLALLEHIHDVVDAIDPERRHFRVDDDGQDVTITPTAANRDLWNDFSPAEGLRTLNDALRLDLNAGPHLVCCTGPQGVALLTALGAYTNDLRAILVTDRDDLAQRALSLCPQTAIVRHPDTLAAILSAAAP
jgi:hypothetical protein